MPCRRGCVLTRGARADDVLKARLKTTGVVEHKFTLARGTEFRGVEWVIYDVGGARSQRQAWAPYFDDGASPVVCLFFRGHAVCMLKEGFCSERDHFPRADQCVRPGARGGAFSPPPPRPNYRPQLTTR